MSVVVHVSSQQARISAFPSTEKKEWKTCLFKTVVNEEKKVTGVVSKFFCRAFSTISIM